MLGLQCSRPSPSSRSDMCSSCSCKSFNLMQALHVIRKRERRKKKKQDSVGRTRILWGGEREDVGLRERLVMIDFVANKGTRLLVSSKTMTGFLISEVKMSSLLK